MGPAARPRRGLILPAALALLAAGCGGAAPGEVRVFAASSLTGVLGDLAREFERTTGTPVRCNFASSAVLARQIVQGAPWDLFLPADPQWADVVEKEVGVRCRLDLLDNDLVFVQGRGLPLLPWTSPGPWRSLGFAPEGRIAVGDPGSVPAGRYAKKALQDLGVWEEVRRRLVPCENVRAALALVERGEAEYGIVYGTDAKASGGVETLTTLGASVARYPLLAVAGGAGGPWEAFFEFLTSDRAKEVFREAGFRIPGEGR